MTLEILPRATDDLVNGLRFYEEKAKGLGAHFRLALFEDVEALRVTAGVHAHRLGYHRSLSKKFPFAIYYHCCGRNHTSPRHSRLPPQSALDSAHAGSALALWPNEKQDHHRS